MAEVMRTARLRWCEFEHCRGKSLASPPMRSRIWHVTANIAIWCLALEVSAARRLGRVVSRAMLCDS